MLTERPNMTLAIHVIRPELTGIVPEIACLSRCPGHCLNVPEKKKNRE